MIKFTQNVGVAPGTTTMQLGGAYTCLDGTGDCSADELLRYTVPPTVMTKTDAKSTGTQYFPYSTIERLKGLNDVSIAPRWGLVLFAGLATFAVVLGARRWYHG